jgi:hypothetical protein
MTSQSGTDFRQKILPKKYAGLRNIPEKRRFGTIAQRFLDHFVGFASMFLIYDI